MSNTNSSPQGSRASTTADLDEQLDQTKASSSKIQNQDTEEGYWEAEYTTLKV
jgi:hypothetical protein